jgi:putative membrane protein
MKAEMKKNDKLAKTLIYIVSAVVFLVVVSLRYLKFTNVDLGFDVHLLAKANALINGSVSVLLVAALIAVKKKNFELHKKLMKGAIYLSVVFLVTYIGHHMFAGETEFPKGNSMRGFYLVILSTHIVLAAVILPFILFTAYRALIAEFPAHKKLAKYTWPIWFYVAVTGVVVYYMISPYYQ